MLLLSRNGSKVYRKYKHRNDESVARKQAAIAGVLLILFLFGASRGMNSGDSSIRREKAIVKTGLSKSVPVVDTEKRLLRLSDILIGQLGKPYCYGAEGPYAFDCSGLVRYVYRQIEIDLPRVVSDQALAGIAVDKQSLQFGDILFFSSQGDKLTHEGIYVGMGYMLHAPKTGDKVSLSRVDSGYFAAVLKKAVRVLN